MANATVHNPSNFEPADYFVVDYFDNQRPTYCGGSIAAYEQEVAAWEADLAGTFGADWRRKIGHCAHCGNGRVRWITAVRHIPTNDVVVFGAICTDRLGFANRVAFKLAQLQARAEARQVRFTIYNKRQAYLQAHPEIAAALDVINEPIHARNAFVRDVLRKLDQYGDLSERQAAAVVSSLQRDREFEARRAADAVEIKGEAPNGRATVTGSVLSVKVQDSDFGPVRKMLVKLENNSRVWVSVPGGSGVERNDVVTFTATFSRKADDPSFAFGSRPRLVNRDAATGPAVETVNPAAPVVSEPVQPVAAAISAPVASGRSLMDLASALDATSTEPKKIDSAA